MLGCGGYMLGCGGYMLGCGGYTHFISSVSLKLTRQRFGFSLAWDWQYHLYTIFLLCTLKVTTYYCQQFPMAVQIRPMAKNCHGITKYLNSMNFSQYSEYKYLKKLTMSMTII
jgi:hypothetical protein